MVRIGTLPHTNFAAQEGALTLLHINFLSCKRGIITVPVVQIKFVIITYITNLHRHTLELYLEHKLSEAIISVSDSSHYSEELVVQGCMKSSSKNFKKRNYNKKMKAHYFTYAIA